MIDLNKLAEMLAAAKIALPVCSDVTCSQIRSPDDDFILYDEGGATEEAAAYVVALLNAGPELIALVRKQGAELSARQPLADSFVAPSVKQLAAQLDSDEKWTIAEQNAFAPFLARFPNECSQGIQSLGSAWKHGIAYANSLAAPAPATPAASVDTVEFEQIVADVLDGQRKLSHLAAYVDAHTARAVAAAGAPLKRANLELSRVNAEQRLQEQRLDLALQRAKQPVARELPPLPAAAAMVKSGEWRDAIEKRQSFNGWRVNYGDCDVDLFTADQMIALRHAAFYAGTIAAQPVQQPAAYILGDDATARISLPVQQPAAVATLPHIPTDAMCRAAREKIGIGSNIADHVWRTMVSEFLQNPASIAHVPAAGVHDAQEQIHIGTRLRRVAKAAGVTVDYGDDAFYYAGAFSILGDIARTLEKPAAGVQGDAVQVSVPLERLQNWIDVIHDNERSMGDRLQSLSSILGALIRGEAVDKYPLSAIREQQPDIGRDAALEEAAKIADETVEYVAELSGHGEIFAEQTAAKIRALIATAPANGAQVGLSLTNADEVFRMSDQSVRIRFASCRSASEFEKHARAILVAAKKGG